MNVITPAALAFDEILFLEQPPNLPEFIESSVYLGQPPLTLVQLQAFEDSIGTSPYDLLDAEREITTIILEFGKGCKPRTSPVWSPAEGRFIEFGDFKAGLVAGIDENNKVGLYANSSAEPIGRGECFRVKLAAGVDDEAFEGHQYLTPSGWRMLRDLRVGDKVATAVRLPVSSPVSIDSREIEIIGFMLGDGHMCQHHQSKTRLSESMENSYFMTSIHDVNARQHFENILRSYDLEPHTVPCKPLSRNVFKTNGTMKFGVVYPRTLSTWRASSLKGAGCVQSRRANPIDVIIRKYGLDNTGPHTKFVPESFFNLPDDQVALFLGALWGTDGTIYLAQKRSHIEISYTTVSAKLAQGVKTMLMRLGIRCQIRVRSVKYSALVNPRGIEERRTAYVVYVSGIYAQARFCQLVRLYDKYDRQAAVLDVFAKTTHGRSGLDGDVFFTRITSIESIGEQEYWDIEVQDIANYLSAGGVVNHNSGKDMMAAHFISWCAYVLLCLKDVGRTLGMPPGEPIDVVNVAPSGKQSREVFFAKLKNRLDRPCFQKFSPDMTTVSCMFKKGANDIRIFSEHSESETYEGYNIFAWVMDECSAFRSKTMARNADKVYNTLRTSASTRFKNRWVGMMLSYPRQSEDFIEKMIKLARTQSSLYGLGPLATWDVLPWLTREDFNNDFEIDPDGAAATLMCLPPAQFHKFFADRAAIDAARRRKTSDFLTIEPFVSVRELPDGQTKEFVALDVKLKNEEVPGSFYIHGDPGLTVDSFQVAIGTTIQRKKVDFPIQVALIHWMPQDQRQVDFLNVGDTIEYLCSHLNVRHVTFDQWNSAHLIQHLLAKGIMATDLSFSNKMQLAFYRNFRSLVNSGGCEITDEELLLQEIKDLERRNNRIDHPSDGSKDAADAVGTVLWFASGAADLILGEAGADMVITDGSMFAGHSAGAPPGVLNAVRQNNARTSLGPISPGLWQGRR